MLRLKQMLKSIVPRAGISAWYEHHAKKRRAELARCETPAETFTAIYRGKHWGRSDDRLDPFYSGLGSRDLKIVGPYVEAVGSFLKGHGSRLNAVDLGCGDFAVGGQLRSYCGMYFACDVVKDVIDRHKTRYGNSDVVFQTIDITRDDLPPGDVVFLRQVLQHLSNNDISSIIPKLHGYKYIIITEDLPSRADFLPNIDKRRGMETRLGLGANGSGVVLTAPPFNLTVKDSRVLCNVGGAIGGSGGRIETLLYEL